MPWNVEYVPEREMVVVTASGVVASGQARAQAREVIRLLKRHKTTLVLIDYFTALSQVSLPELYWLSYHASTLGLPWNVRLAVLLPQDRYRIESYQFFELVFRNVGYNIKLFDDRESLEAWLGAPKADKTEAHCAPV